MPSHRPLVGVSVFFALGIMAGSCLWSGFLFLGIGCALSLSLSVLFIKREALSLSLLWVSLIFLGALSVVSSKTVSSDHLYRIFEDYRGRPVFVEGVIVSDVQKRKFFHGQKTVFTLEARRFKAKYESPCAKTGRILVQVFRAVDLHYGDAVLLEGRLHEPFDFSSNGPFSYKEYLSQKGIKLILSVKKRGHVELLDAHRANPLKEGALRLRGKFKDVLARYLPHNEAAMMSALILGERYDIPRSLKELFVQTGTAHILAVSGFNVGIIAFVVFLFLKVLRFGRNAQYALTILILIGYAVLTGGQAPVVRATIMAVIFLGAFLVERESDALNSLALAATVLFLTNPLNLFDVGFQLSFVCVFSLIQGVPRMWNGIFPDEGGKGFLFYLKRYFLGSLAVSLAAWIGVAGLIAYYFHIVTPITIVANLFIVPLVSVITALGLGLLLTGFFFPGLALIFSMCAQLGLNLMVALTYLLSKIPGAYFYLEKVLGIEVVLYYLIVALVVWRGLLIKGLRQGFRLLSFFIDPRPFRLYNPYRGDP